MPRYAIDERRIKHWHALAPPSPVPCDPPQFTLRGFFTFVTATAVCLSLAVTGARIEPDQGFLLTMSAVVFFWIVLSVTYRKLRLRGTLLCHCLVPAVLSGFVLTYLVVLLAAGASDFFESADVLVDTLLWLVLALLTAIVAGCLLGSLLSVSVFAAAMFLAILKARRNGSE